jgi:hypothetical protein
MKNSTSSETMYFSVTVKVSARPGRRKHEVFVGFMKALFPGMMPTVKTPLFLGCQVGGPALPPSDSVSSSTLPSSDSAVHHPTL